MAKLNVIASPVVTDDSVLSEDDLCPNIVHIEGIAELPNIEVSQVILDCVHTMQAHFEHGEKFDGQACRSHKSGAFLPTDFENGRF